MEGERETAASPESSLTADPAGLYELLQLHSLKAATEEASLDDYRDGLRGQIKTSLEEQGMSVQQLGRQYHQELQPVIEEGLLIVLMARHNRRTGQNDRPESQKTVQESLAELTFFHCQMKILFLHEFRDELPDDIVADLDEYPRLTLVGIGQQNYQPHVPSHSSETESATPPAATTAPQAAVSGEAEAKSKEINRHGADEGSEPSELPPEDLEAEETDSEYIRVDPESIMTLSPERVSQLANVHIKVGDELVEGLQLEEKYVLAFFVQAVRSRSDEELWIRPWDCHHTPLMDAIIDYREFHASANNIFKQSVKRIGKLSSQQEWPVWLRHNGGKARSSKYTLQGNPEQVAFLAPADFADYTDIRKDTSEVYPAHTTSQKLSTRDEAAEEPLPDQSDAGQLSPGEATSDGQRGPTPVDHAATRTEVKGADPEESNIDRSERSDNGEQAISLQDLVTPEEVKYAQDYFLEDEQWLLAYIISKDDGVSIEELQVSCPGVDMRAFTRKIRLWNSKCDRPYEIDSGTQNGRVNVR